MKTTLTDESTREIYARLQDANRETAARYPGESFRRQPVHTVYGGAHLFKSDTTRKLGDLAVKALDQYAPEPRIFADAIGLDARHAGTVHGRVRNKLQREAVEDFRIDFEDGYGNRSDEEEDGQAETCASELALGLREKTLPASVGVRVKTLSDDRLARRAVRTADVLLTALVDATGWRRQLWQAGLQAALTLWILFGLPLLAWLVARRQHEQREVIRNLSEAMEQNVSPRKRGSRPTITLAFCGFWDFT